ncbi:Mobile element protein [Escherichia coli]|nr:Mobile element protein [Escherichia coli]
MSTLSVPTLRSAEISGIVSAFPGKRKLTAVCSHQTRIGNLDAHLI